MSVLLYAKSHNIQYDRILKNVFTNNRLTFSAKEQLSNCPQLKQGEPVRGKTSPFNYNLSRDNWSLNHPG